MSTPSPLCKKYSLIADFRNYLIKQDKTTLSSIPSFIVLDMYIYIYTRRKIATTKSRLLFHKLSRTKVGKEVLLSLFAENDSLGIGRPVLESFGHVDAVVLVEQLDEAVVLGAEIRVAIGGAEEDLRVRVVLLLEQLAVEAVHVAVQLLELEHVRLEYVHVEGGNTVIVDGDERVEPLFCALSDLGRRPLVANQRRANLVIVAPVLLDQLDLVERGKELDERHLGQYQQVLVARQRLEADCLGRVVERTVDAELVDQTIEEAILPRLALLGRVERDQRVEHLLEEALADPQVHVQQIGHEAIVGNEVDDGLVDLAALADVLRRVGHDARAMLGVGDRPVLGRVVELLARARAERTRIGRVGRVDAHECGEHLLVGREEVLELVLALAHHNGLERAQLVEQLPEAALHRRVVLLEDVEDAQLEVGVDEAVGVELLQEREREVQELGLLAHLGAVRAQLDL